MCLKAVIAMKNGDTCPIENADHLFEFFSNREAFAKVPKGTPLYKSGGHESDLITVELDECFVTFSLDSISHITWVK
jgi:hypothetical protein